jgi:polyamine oxidase
MIKQPQKKKIIIVGAGIAGLAACNRLIECGFDVTILEARDRCGGRIWIDNNTLGLPFGLGAGWIHGVDDNPIAQLAEKFHTQMVTVDPNKFITFDRKGNPISQNAVQKFNEKFAILLDQAKELAFKSKHDISLSTVLSSIIQKDNFSSIEQELLEAKFISLESYLGANNESLSARYWDQDEVWPGDNCFVTDTYYSIVENLAKKCPIQFNVAVKKINMHESNIEIITENSVFYADAVIITVPLGVLKKDHIIFNPPLPNYKQQAIQRLEMGLFNITAIKFPKPFWPKENHAMIFSHFDTSSIPVFFNLYHFTSQPIIVGYSGGKRAKELENFTDAELIEKTMDNFTKVFGENLPSPESYINTRWSQDSFSNGSYSYTPTGASSEDYEAIAKPVLNKIFFAGEATSSKYPATTHGAYLSGIREAEKLIELTHE